MLAEAAATGNPVYIYPLPKRQLDLWTQVKEWIVARGEKQRLGHRGDYKAAKGCAISLRVPTRRNGGSSCRNRIYTSCMRPWWGTESPSSSALA